MLTKSTKKKHSEWEDQSNFGGILVLLSKKKKFVLKKMEKQNQTVPEFISEKDERVKILVTS